MLTPPVCLTIAGSDPSGGAGIQGDLKTFCAHGVYGMAVITALTAQNTCRVSGVSGVSAAFVIEQLERVYEDIPTDFVKTGMLFNREVVSAVAGFFSEIKTVRLVVDPVMISSSGAELLLPDAVDEYRTNLIKMAYVVTPNHLESQLLSGVEVTTVEAAMEASEIIRAMGPQAVLVKGGDVSYPGYPDCVVDVLNDGGRFYVFEKPLRGSLNSHGTGCAMAAAICSQLGHGKALVEAVKLGGDYVGAALGMAYPTGKGSGSINHLWNVKFNCEMVDDSAP